MLSDFTPNEISYKHRICSIHKNGINLNSQPFDLSTKHTRLGFLWVGWSIKYSLPRYLALLRKNRYIRPNSYHGTTIGEGKKD